VHGKASGDQTRFTFALRPARFHDGTAVTAADVKATLDRVATKATMSPVAPILAAVRGYGEAHDLGSAAELTGVSAPDANTVVIELTHPLADFPVVLAHPALGVVPGDRASSLADDPVGSGPFRFESRSVTDTTLRRVVSPGQVPRAARVVLVPVASADAGVRALQDRAVDVAPLEGSTTGPPPGAVLVETPSLDVVSYGLNLRNLAVGDERFRRAILHGFNREKLTREAYGTSARVADGIIPDGVPGARRAACGDVCKPDTAGAVQLVREAFPDGNPPILALDFPDRDDQRRLAQEAQGQLAEVGIPTKLSPHPPEQYAAFLTTGSAQLFLLPRDGMAPAAALYVAPFVSAAAENTIGVTSPQVDGEIATADAERDLRARREHYAVAARTVLDQAAVLPIAQLEHRVAVSTRVRAFDLDILGTFDPLAVRVVAGRGSAGGGG
jgi:peptide/nickel transport system substrate-binding protein/oligopeptide transport system substrate-binding protein